MGIADCLKIRERRPKLKKKIANKVRSGAHSAPLPRILNHLCQKGRGKMTKIADCVVISDYSRNLRKKNTILFSKHLWGPN